MKHSIKAAELFNEGYNCAQAVAVAFCDVTGLDKDFTAKLLSGFGGGIGGLHETCGAVSGMVMVLDQLYGFQSPADVAGKKWTYAQVHELVTRFKKKTGSYICRDLLKDPLAGAQLSPEAAELCAKRPCARLVMEAADLLDAFIAQHPLET